MKKKILMAITILAIAASVPTSTLADGGAPPPMCAPWLCPDLPVAK